MALLTWSDKYSVKIKEIDDQHKKLFDLLNELHDAMCTGKGKDALGKVLAELTNYTVYHFGTEEKLFQKYGYPESDQHKAEHEKLVKQVLAVKAEFESGAVGLSPKVLDFLRDWLNNHILGTDKKYAPFLAGKGVV